MNNFISFIYPKSYLEKLDKKINRLDNKINRNKFLIIRILVELILFIGLLLIPVYGFMLSILITIIFHFLYEDILITSPLIKRNNLIYKDFKYFMEMYLEALLSNYDTYDAFLYTVSLIDNTLTKEIKSLKKDKTDFNSLLKRVSLILPDDLASDMLSLCDLSKNEVKEKVKDICQNLDSTKDYNNQNNVNNIPIKVILISIVFLIIVLFIILEGPAYL